MDNRELKEVLFALIYRRYFSHGTDGHHKLMIIAKLAEKVGYSFRDLTLLLDGVEIFTLE